MARTALQVIYQFTKTVTSVSVKYPEPANSMCNSLAVFSLQILNFAPPECADRRANFFTKLLITTLGPIGLIPFIFVYHACIERAPNAGLKTLGTTTVLFELVLSSVTTSIFRTWDCGKFGGTMYLKAQLNMQCEGPTYEWWKRYAVLMSLVYPVGVPLGMLTSLFCIRRDIKFAMDNLQKRSLRTGATCRVEELPDEEVCDPEDGRDAGDGLVRLNPKRIRFVRTMGFLFEKFEPDAWWFGVFQIEVRLLETSFLVFIKRRIM